MTQINLEQYSNFVDAVTSAPSKNFDAYIKALTKLQQHVDVPRLDTALTGLMTESGEAMELLKKLKFHDKEWTDETRRKLSKELGDILWYWMNACRALDLDPYSVINENVEKLEARHPAGEFNIHFESTRTAADS
jgi:NTP pyrophosphatase (non-canonical NTP hydrolase)